MKKFLIIVIVFVCCFCQNVFALENPFQKQLQVHLNQQIGTDITNISHQEVALEEKILERDIAPKTLNTFQMTFSDTVLKYDVFSDESLQKFVGVNTPLNNVFYEPADLVNISSKYITGNSKLRQEAKDSLDILAKDFYTVFKKPLKVVSAYRSYEDQLFIEKNSPQCIATRFCAKAGYSEHQLGLAIDVSGLNTAMFQRGEYKRQYDWMKQNAHKYGWHQSYRKGSKVDGYNAEPWHWRYIGIDLATELYEKNITFTEYFVEENIK